MIVADTDVLIDYLNNFGVGAARIAQALESEDLRTTVITRFELLSGARRPAQEQEILALLEAVPSLPLDPESADIAARVRRELDEVGLRIAEADSLIAGIVLQHSAIFLTRNREHFGRVKDLHLGEMGIE